MHKIVKSTEYQGGGGGGGPQPEAKQREASSGISPEVPPCSPSPHTAAACNSEREAWGKGTRSTTGLPLCPYPFSASRAPNRSSSGQERWLPKRAVCPVSGTLSLYTHSHPLLCAATCSKGMCPHTHTPQPRNTHAHPHLPPSQEHALCLAARSGQPARGEKSLEQH